MRLKLILFNTKIIPRASSYSYKEIDTDKWIEPDERKGHYSTNKVIFALLYTAKATLMLIWSLCYHGLMAYKAKTGIGSRPKQSQSHSYLWTLEFVTPMVTPDSFLLYVDS